MTDETPNSPEMSAPAKPATSVVAKAARIPIWHSPAWITAIVALVSVFFTVPEVLGNYLSTEQATEAARQTNIQPGLVSPPTMAKRPGSQKELFRRAVIDKYDAQFGNQSTWIVMGEMDRGILALPHIAPVSQDFLY